VPTNKEADAALPVRAEEGAASALGKVTGFDVSEITLLSEPCEVCADAPLPPAPAHAASTIVSRTADSENAFL